MRPSQVMINGLSKRFRQQTVLDNVHLALQGGVVTLLGPNGSGKTSLLRCLATVTEPTSGSILIDGLDPRHESDRIEVRRRLGYMPQDAQLARKARVFDVLDYIGCLRLENDERIRRHSIYAALDQVGLADRATDSVDDLSGGMRQRLNLAQAILFQPSLLILDEPAAGLDPDERFRLRSIMAEQRHAATVIVSTHLTDESEHSDTIIVLVEGVLRFVGPPSSLRAVADGRVWIQNHQPVGVRASWRQSDGRYRCLGNPPGGVQPVEATVEDGYLLTATPTVAA